MSKDYLVGGPSPVKKKKQNISLVHCGKLKFPRLICVYSHVLVVRKCRASVVWLSTYYTVLRK